MTGANQRTGGRILVDALRGHGVDTVFCVPGESYLATLDALHDAAGDIRLIVCRQEGGAANMAEAHAKLTGRPGICFVTRGPGAANASVGIHTAFQDATPVILFVGQITRSHAERRAFQEVDFRRMFGPLTKWVAQIDDAGRIPEMVAHAFQVATSGRQGPVVLAIPEDMQTDRAAVADAGHFVPVAAHPGSEALATLLKLLDEAARPLMIVGGSGWTSGAVADITAFAERFDLPVGTAFRRQDLFDNAHPNYAGHVGLGINPALLARLAEADLLLVVGAQLGEIETQGFTLFDIPRPRQTLIHVLAGAEEIGQVYQPTLGINAAPVPFAATVRALAPAHTPVWRHWRRAARADYEAHVVPPPMPGALDLGRIIAWLSETLPEDAIIANGAGNYSLWVHRFYRYRRHGTQLAPMSGAMGYGVPAAIAAKLARPDRIVVSISGDGCFLMHGQELATAVQHRLGIVFLVVNNGIYGTIRMHQERHYPARVIGTDLVNPDFAAYARAFGAAGEIVERTEDFAPAFQRAMAVDGPALIELRLDPDAISPTATLSGLRGGPP